MGMTMTQKILAAHAHLPAVKAGQLINADLDMVLGNDITTPVAINEFNKAGFDGVFDSTNSAGSTDGKPAKETARPRGRPMPAGRRPDSAAAVGPEPHCRS